MGKKQKKKQQKPTVAKEKAKVSNIKTINCVECLQNGRIIKREECKACGYYNEGYCTFVEPQKKIEVINFATPMRYNRNFFQMSSDSLREASLNYYIYTDVMNEVRDISGYPNYRKLKTDLLGGRFKQVKEDKEPEVISMLEPVLAFELSGEFSGGPDKFDMVVDGNEYKLIECETVQVGDWTVLFYLYRVYDLDGFGDIEVSGQPYKVLFNESPMRKADLLVAQKEEYIVIGRRK